MFPLSPEAILSPVPQRGSPVLLPSPRAREAPCTCSGQIDLSEFFLV